MKTSHESAYQNFAFHIGEDFVWSKQYKFKYSLIYKNSNVLNEVHYINVYNRTAIHEIALNFNQEKFQFYPDYFKDYVQEHIIDKYDLINYLPSIRKSFDFDRPILPYDYNF